MFSVPFLAILGSACALFLAGLLALALYGLWFVLNAYLHGLMADDK